MADVTASEIPLMTEATSTRGLYWRCWLALDAANGQRLRQRDDTELVRRRDARDVASPGDRLAIAGEAIPGRGLQARLERSVRHGAHDDSLGRLDGHLHARRARLRPAEFG